MTLSVDRHTGNPSLSNAPAQADSFSVQKFKTDAKSLPPSREALLIEQHMINNVQKPPAHGAHPPMTLPPREAAAHQNSGAHPIAHRNSFTRRPSQTESPKLKSSLASFVDFLAKLTSP
jgi:hypothetical protein